MNKLKIGEVELEFGDGVNVTVEGNKIKVEAKPATITQWVYQPPYQIYPIPYYYGSPNYTITSTSSGFSDGGSCTFNVSGIVTN